MNDHGLDHPLRTARFTPGVDGGDFVTRDQFGDFELTLDWRIGPGGNSGIFYRASEAADRIWEDAPEMQILDDEGHADGARGHIGLQDHGDPIWFRNIRIRPLGNGG